MKWQPAGSVISVFISHASQDTRFAESLAVDLRSHDFLARTFRDVLPSDASLRDDRLDSRLGQAIDDDAFFVPVLSPAFVRSKWVGVELERALRSEVRRQEIGVIPALARRCSPPEALGLRTPSDFTRSYAEGFEDLVARLSAPKTSLTSAAERSANFQASEGAAEKLREYLAEHPEKLSSLTPRKFEELVAELFRDHFELEVQLQSTTRDGGVDIVVLGGKDAQHTPILLHCKRYASQRRVGVEVVRSLFASMAQQGVNRGMLVTTSSFTKRAIEETKRLRQFSRDRWSLDLVDYDTLVGWLAHTPNLTADITTPVRQIRKRYADLVDKKFTSALSPNERAELRRLVRTLDEAEAPFYQPLKQALRIERDRLLKVERAKVKADK